MRMVLPLTEEDVTRARACEEMIMFEKLDQALVPNVGIIRNFQLRI